MALGVALVVVVLVAINLFDGDGTQAPGSAPASRKALTLPVPVVPSGRELFVSPEGKPTNPGTREAPVDLATALSSNTPASPGSVIWLRQGAYIGNFTSALSGTEAAPIHVRQYPGERATLQGLRLDEPVLTVAGSWTWYREFEVTASPAGRSRAAGNAAVDVRNGGGVLVRGPNVALVNLVVHDLPKSIEVLQGAERVLLSGNLIYYTWWPGQSTGVGLRLVPGNVEQFVVGNTVFGQGAAGITVGLSSGGQLLLERNASFNNGLQSEFYDRNLLVEGGTMKVNRNYTYYEPTRRGGENNFGYSSGCASIGATDNYFAHRAYPFTLAKCTGKLTGNVFIGPVDPAVIAQHPDNTYLRTPPEGLRTFIDADPYNNDRIRIIVFNWDKHPAVNVELADAKLAPGTSYEIRDAQNYFGPPVATGVYEGGRITIPASGLTLATPAGNGPIGAGLKHSGPEFLVFFLVKTAARPPASANGSGKPQVLPGGRTF